jgi:hypothetical protein
MPTTRENDVNNDGVTYGSWDTAERLVTAAGDAAVWHLGYPEEPQRPGFMHVRWGPHEGSPAHRHKSWTANVVIRGPLKIGETWYQTGAVAIFEPNIYYGPLEAGPEGAELLEIHATSAGLEPIWQDPSDPVARATMEWAEESGKAAWKPEEK